MTFYSELNKHKKQSVAAPLKLRVRHYFTNMTIYYYLHQQSEAGLLRFSLEYQQTSAAFIIPTYGCSLAIEQAAVRLRKIEGKTVTTDTLSLHPRRTPRV